MKWFSFILLLLVACQDSPWSSSERKEFIEKCREEGGTNDYCDCFLEKLSNKSSSFDELDNITYEERVEISSECH